MKLRAIDLEDRFGSYGYLPHEPKGQLKEVVTRLQLEDIYEGSLS